MHATSAEYVRAMNVHVCTRSQLKATAATWPRTEPKLARSKTQKGDDERGPSQVAYAIMYATQVWASTLG